MSERLWLLGALLLICPAVPAQEGPVRDPMRPPVIADGNVIGNEAEPRLYLTAILISATRRIAVVNGAFYRVGDRIGADEIVAIEPGSIRIRQGGETISLALRERASAVATTETTSNE